MSKTILLHEELTYVIRGILFEVHNELGQYRNEKQFCDRIGVKLGEKSIPFVREFVLPSSFVGEFKGRNRLDFLVDDRVILEIKVVPSFSREIYNQCLRYLVSADKELLLLVNFYHKTVVVKRILNPHRKG